jgi:hypothetical protein
MAMPLRPDRPKKPEPPLVPPRARTLADALAPYLQPDDLSVEARKRAEAAMRAHMDGVDAIDAAACETGENPDGFVEALDRVLAEWGIAA